MAKEVEFSFEIDDEIKKQAEKGFAKYGITFADGMILFAKEIVKKGKIPFDIQP